MNNKYFKITLIFSLKELETAKAHGTKNKRLALQALKRKKSHEKQLEHIDGVLNTIQHQKGSLENASMNSGVFNAISDAAKALKVAHNEMNVDKVTDNFFFKVL